MTMCHHNIVTWIAPSKPFMMQPLMDCPDELWLVLILWQWHYDIDIMSIFNLSQQLAFSLSLLVALSQQQIKIEWMYYLSFLLFIQGISIPGTECRSPIFLVFFDIIWRIEKSSKCIWGEFCLKLVGGCSSTQIFFVLTHSIKI